MEYKGRFYQTSIYCTLKKLTNAEGFSIIRELHDLNTHEPFKDSKFSIAKKKSEHTEKLGKIRRRRWKKIELKHRQKDLVI